MTSNKEALTKAFPGYFGLLVATGPAVIGTTPPHSVRMWLVGSIIAAVSTELTLRSS
ncbi:hypothetical protein BDW75DRAFT_217073 [Aspergillus navahoensis]